MRGGKRRGLRAALRVNTWRSRLVLLLDGGFYGLGDLARNGAAIIRAHDVAETVQALRVHAAIEGRK